MLYSDNIHLISTSSITELHMFAQRIGLKRCWFENKAGKDHPHYDLVNKKKVPLVCQKTGKKYITKAIEAGAKVVTTREMILIIQMHTQPKLQL